MRAMAVFCASGLGSSALFQDAARATGAALARAGIELVYGGGHVGLMGLVADAALAAGGKVTGVMPQALVDAEIAHPGLTTLHVVATMHERKTAMSDLSDAFITLPGGPGTMEEIFEQWTWGLLGVHAKPCGFLEVGGYYDPLRAMIGNMVAAGFLSQAHSDMVIFEPDVAGLLARFDAYVAPAAKYTKAAE